MSCYEEHYVTVKKYRDKYKTVVMNGYNPERKKSGDCHSYDQKLENNLSRSRQMVFELGYCNDWEYFVTMTLDKEKFDRYDLPAWYKSLSQWLRHYQRKTGQKISYLLIPEQHKDGAWHIHGLLSGVPVDRLQPFEKGTPLYGSDYLNWLDYAKKYGFCSVGVVGNREAVSKYITKYIIKDMARLNSEVGAHLYYCSRGLKRAETVTQDFIYTGYVNMSFDYEGKYCGVKWSDSMENAMRYYYCDNYPMLDMDEFDEIEV